MTATEAPEAPAPPTVERLKDGRVRCVCGAEVKPTRRGGSRPRPHLRPEGGRCMVVHPTETLCKRCGGTADKPIGSCRSPVFHPAEWRGEPSPDNPLGSRYGNAAAAGAVLGVSGEYFEYILRRYPEGAPSRPPEPVGIDLRRRYMYWDLDQVEAFDQNRPGLVASAQRLAELRQSNQEAAPPDEIH